MEQEISCGYTPTTREQCLYPSGPCPTPTPGEKCAYKPTAPAPEGNALTVAFTALNKMAGSELDRVDTPPDARMNLLVQTQAAVGLASSPALKLTMNALERMIVNDYTSRSEIYSQTLKEVRALIGPSTRLTTLNVVCAWCGASTGDKEGNGMAGTTWGICPTCGDVERKLIVGDTEATVRLL